MKGCLRTSLTVGFCLFILAFMAIDVGAETISVPFDPAEATIVVDVDGVTDFKGPALQRLNPVGAPNLPWQVVDVLLPPDAELASVTARMENARWEIVADAVQIAPAPPEVTWRAGRPAIDWPRDRQLADGRDTDIYERDFEYPEAPVKLIGTGRMRQWRLAQVGVPLFRWNPARNQLRRLIGGQLTVAFNSPVSRQRTLDRVKALKDPFAMSTVRQIAVNFASQAHTYTQALQELTSASDNGSEGELPLSEDAGTYIILTTSVIQTASGQLADFAAHKTNQGFTVQVATESDWGGGIGDTAAENMRAWLQANYVTEAISHVLLIGNPNPSTGDVPMKLTYPKTGSSTTPTDYYYADLTGNWDLDGDGHFGEFVQDFGAGGVDRYWEVLVGRIPYYGNIADLDGILTRIIAYQAASGEDIAWRKHVLLPMDDLGDWYPLSEWLGEDIRNDILAEIGWPSHRIYDDYWSIFEAETEPCTKDNVVGVWSGEPFGLVVWFTHGAPTSATDVIDSGRVDELDDTYPSFTFQASCNTAWPENGSNLAYALLREGGISTIGATRESWSLSDHAIAGKATIEGMAYEYTKRVAAMGMPAARALNMLRQKIAPNSSYAGQWMNYVDCNVYGDPATTLYTSPRPVRNLTQDRRYPVIQWAVDDADEGDEIVLDPGTYTGWGNRDVDFFGKNLTVRSIDPTDPAVVAATVIDAQGARNIFKIQNGENNVTLIQGLTLTGTGTGFYASAIYGRNSSPTVSGCVFSGNNTRGIYLENGSMRIEDCTFAANGGSDENGGGIYTSTGSPQIVDCRFATNTARNGGGIYTSGGAPLIIGCSFIGNSATSQGGGTYGVTSQGDLIVQDCLFSGNNSLGRGGGLYIQSKVHVINSVLTGNRAATDGGGVMMINGGSSLTQCTLVGNRAANGGGIGALGGTATIDNSIVWGNAAATGHQITLITHYALQTVLNLNHCDLDGGTADVVIGANCFLNWTDGITVDPELVDPGFWDDNGTPGDLSDDVWHVGDYHLAAGSPCIDTGNDTALHLPDFDFDGDLRRIDGDGDGTSRVDIGADEYTQIIACQGDLDHDGDVDGRDLAILAGNPTALDWGVFASGFGTESCE